MKMCINSTLVDHDIISNVIAGLKVVVNIHHNYIIFNVIYIITIN